MPAPTPSPAVTISDAGGTPVLAGTSTVYVNPGDVITIALNSTVSVTSWTVKASATDSLLAAGIGYQTTTGPFSFTFIAPPHPCRLALDSSVSDGFNDYTTRISLQTGYGTSAAAQLALTQALWVVDPVNGNDANPGTAAAPVKTIQGGIVPKWGTTFPILAQTTTISFLTSETAGQESAVLEPALVGGSNLIIKGTLAPVGSTFSPTTVTAKARGSPGTLLRLNGVPGAAAAGMVVTNITKSSQAFIDSVAGGNATMTQPFANAGLTTVTTGQIATLVEDDTWAATDVYQLNSLPIVNLKVLRPRGTDSSSTALSNPVVWTQYVRLPDSTGTPGFSVFLADATHGTSMVFSMCWFDCQFVGVAVEAGALLCANLSCWHNGGAIGDSWALVGGASDTTGSFFLDGTYILNLGGLDGDIICHGGIIAKGAYSIVGLCYIDAASTSTVSRSVLAIEPFYFSSSKLWGPGTLNLSGGQVQNNSGQTWATILTVATLQLDGATTGTSYSAGAFTDGRSLTSANLDTFNGLQNPRTGSRFWTN